MGEGGRQGKLIMGLFFLFPGVSWDKMTSVQTCLWAGGRKRRRQTGCKVSREKGVRWLAEKRDVRQTSVIPNSGRETKVSCGRIQQNAIKDKFFIVLSCRQLGKISLSQHK